MGKADDSVANPPFCRTVEDRFLTVNRERLRRTRECLNPRQQIFFDVLPLLLHTNHPMLPGYVSQSTPCGIQNFVPSEESIRAARAISRAFTLRSRQWQPKQIVGIYFMGSSGTVAHSGNSDFDVWLCHDPDIAPEQLQTLQRKTALIEEWANGMGLEVHFFILDPVRFRQGENQQLSGENSGSTQHILLLDEFYRSSVVVAGLYPIWWLVPPEHESNYSEYVEDIVAKRVVTRRDFVDLGGLAELPADEFGGAALWQLYKSVNYPYKSVLKLLLVEVYANDYPNCDLLSAHYKRLVYNGKTELKETDPYLLLYRKIEEYLLARQESMRLNLLRRCFYLKVNEKLSRWNNPREENWRREMLRAMVTSWGWDEARLLLLDAEDRWKLPTITNERRDLVQALTQSYRMLSQFARKHTQTARITPGDLNVLGRKLYAAFERKANKVDIIIRGITRDLLESEVSFHQVNAHGKQDSWVIYRGIVTPQEVGDHTPLKRAPSVVQILVWCHLNRLINAQTNISLYTDKSDPSVCEIKSILEVLESLFPNGTLQEPSYQDLSHPARATAAALFINVGVGRKTWQKNRVHFSSSRSNALSYGGLRENLASTFDLVIASSWDEVFTFHYSDVRGLMQCICEYLRWLTRSQQRSPLPISVSCLSSGYGPAISNTIRTLLTNIADCYGAGSSVRYVLEIENRYYVLAADDSSDGYKEFPSRSRLLRYLKRPNLRFRPVTFDRHALPDSPLPRIYMANRVNKVQLFVHGEGPSAAVYVLDEKGSLFQQKVPFYNSRWLLHHFNRFFSSVIPRLNILLDDLGEHHSDIELEFYALRAEENDSFRLERLPQDPDWADDHVNLQVICDRSENKQTVFTVYCNDVEFSSLEHGDNLFKSVARYLLELRRSGLCYPVYLTDIDLSRFFLGEKFTTRLQSIHFLNYKNHIEKRLNQAMRELEERS